MSMDRLHARLQDGQPPLRTGELAELIGYSTPTVRKFIEADVIRTVGLTSERRVPVREARRLCDELGIDILKG